MISNTAAKLERLTLELTPPIARIALSNPPLNVIDVPLMEQLAVAFIELESRSAISTVLIRASGDHFSAGVDVAAHTPDKVSEMLEKFHAVIRALVASRKITIAAVTGNCLGGGAELALVCDVVITSEDATWGFPEIQLGCFPPIAATALSALVGQKRAAELVLTGRTLTGAEAAEIGLATTAVPADRLNSAVDEVLRRLQTLSPVALAIAKKAIYAWDSIHFDKGLARAEKIYQEELIQTEDAQEGIRAFLEKRSPRWKGR
jgi:cyclohexa-1,5-dienecarbonyl-CoA hydratase